MGTWAAGTFGNDEALDFLLSLEEIRDRESLVERIRLAFDKYSAYEQRRLAGTNTFLFTEEWLRNFMIKGGCAQEDIDRLTTELASQYGMEHVDVGGDEANEVVAAAEIVLSVLRNDWSTIHEDGLFLRQAQLPITPDDAALAVKTLDAMLLNKPLFKEFGRAWKKNVVRLHGELSESTSRFR